MFTDAMSMLGDPSAVKEAEAMMNDPEFKSEINQYMETLKNNSAFRDAMAEAQRKYQVRHGGLRRLLAVAMYVCTSTCQGLAVGSINVVKLPAVCDQAVQKSSRSRGDVTAVVDTLTRSLAAPCH